MTLKPFCFFCFSVYAIPWEGLSLILICNLIFIFLILMITRFEGKKEKEDNSII